MKYTHFETLALVLGGLAIAASLFMAPTAAPQSAEVAAQLILIAVLAAALHWGRNGGFLAAVIAIAVYVVMRLPLLESQGLSNDLLTMLGARVVTYALIGVIGGEVASRIKYVFAKMESNALVDPVTGVYSPRYAAENILSGVGQWDRYKTDYSVVRATVSDSLYSGLKASRYRQLMRQVAAHLRNDIRMVDDLAFVAPSTFLVLLPRTPETGAQVVSDRLGKGVCELLGAKPESVPMTVMSAETSARALRSLAETIHPDPVELAPAPVPEPLPAGLDRRSPAAVEAVQEPSE